MLNFTRIILVLQVDIVEIVDREYAQFVPKASVSTKLK